MQGYASLSLNTTSLIANGSSLYSILLFGKEMFMIEFNNIFNGCMIPVTLKYDIECDKLKCSIVYEKRIQHHG